MRVHHVTSNYSLVSGGAERTVRALHLGLLARGIESHVIGILEQPDPDLPNGRTLGLRTAYRPAAVLGLRRYLRSQIREGDIVHAHLFPQNLFVSLLGGRKGSRRWFVCTEHSTSNRRRGSLWGHSLDRLTYKIYDRIAAISSGVERSLLSWRPELRGKTQVILNGADLFFDRVLARPPRSKLRVVSVGNLRKAKNYDTILRALFEVRDMDFEYLIAGTGREEKPLRGLCAEMGLEDRVRFLGYVQPIHALLESADIFLMASRWEGFGLAAVEAMNASLPLIVSDVAGLREIVMADPPCALLVDPESPESIAAALRRLIADHSLRIAFGEAGFKRAADFSLENMVDGYCKLYSELE